MRGLFLHLTALSLALLLAGEGSAAPLDRDDSGKGGGDGSQGGGSRGGGQGGGKQGGDQGGGQGGGRGYRGDRCCDNTPPVLIRLGAADACGIPGNDCHARTGGGNFFVRQPSHDTLIITMTGLARAEGSALPTSAADFRFDLQQAFTVVFDTRACCAVTCDGIAPHPEIAAFCLPTRSVGPKENLSIYLRSKRLCVPVVPGCYTLHQTFAIAANEPRCSIPGHGASADFSTSEDQRVDFGHRRDPFEGVTRRDFGFHVIVKVSPADQPAASIMPATPAPPAASKSKDSGH
jgi:hypothetical protein